MRARQVDGFISATARLDRELLADVAAAGTPLVLVNRSLEDGSVPAVDGQRPAGDPARGRARGAARARADRPRRRTAEHLDRTPAPPRVSRGDARLWARRRPASTCASADGFTEEEGARVCAELLDAVSRPHRDRGGQRPARDRLLRRAGGARAALPGGHLDRRLQRHAVHRPAAAAADLGAGAPARDRHRRRRPAAPAARRRLADGSRDPARADADRPGLDGAAAQAARRGVPPPE